MTLAEAKLNCLYSVEGFVKDLEKDKIIRMEDYGLHQGLKITVQNRSLFSGVMQVFFSNSYFMVRKDIAKSILVKELELFYKEKAE